MENKKKKNKWFLKIVFIFFIVYMGLYVSLQMGYYQTPTNENVFYTKEQIEQFEKDVKEGKEIDINSYTVEKINYNNKITDFSLSATRTIEKVFNSCISKVLYLVTVLIG